MRRDLFAPISRKKLLIYVGIAGAVILAGCGWLLYLDTPLWRVLLVAGFTTALFCGVVGGVIWLIGGQRSEVPIGPAAVRPPMRFLKALPYMIGIVALFQVIKLLEVLTSK